MARKRQTKIKTFKVNRGDPAYGIIEEIEKRKLDFSKIIRNLLVSEFSNKEEFKGARIRRILNKRKELKKKVPKISRQLSDYEEELTGLGYELNKDE